MQQKFERSKHDYGLFLKNKEDKKLFVLILVDDLVIAGKSQREIDKLNSSLVSKFEMDDRRDLEWFLGIEFQKQRRNNFRSRKEHSKYFRTVQCAKLQTKQNTGRI